MKGELDWILLKALEKDRARRYESANGLAADVTAFVALALEKGWLELRA